MSVDDQRIQRDPGAGMPRFHRAGEDEVEPSPSYAATCRAEGPLVAKRLTPDWFPLWLFVTRLGAGARLRWEGAHGDEALFVIAGELEVLGERTGPECAVLLESGAAGEVRATSDGAKLAHFGPADPEPPSTGPLGPPRAEGHRVRVIGPRGRCESPAGRPYFRFYADSTEPTSRAFLLYSAREPGWSVDFHEHSTDELVFLLTGSVRFGKRQRYAAGSCLALAAGQRYALAAGPEGFTSINYRRDASTLRYPGREESWLETGATAGGIPVIEQAEG